MGETVVIREGRGTYQLREVVSAEAKQARPLEPGEREPLTWEEFLSLPAEQRARWDGGQS